MASERYNKTFLRADSLEDAQDALQEVNEANPDAVIIVEEEGKECIIEHGKQLDFVPSTGKLGQVLTKTENGNEFRDVDIPEDILTKETADATYATKDGVKETLEKVGFEKVEVLFKEEKFIEIRPTLPFPVKKDDVLSLSVVVRNTDESEGGSGGFSITNNLGVLISNTVSYELKSGESKTIIAIFTVEKDEEAPKLFIYGDSWDSRPFEYSNIVIAKGDTPISWEESENLEDSYNSPFIKKDEAKELFEEKFEVGTGLEMTPDRTLNVNNVVSMPTGLLGLTSSTIPQALDIANKRLRFDIWHGNSTPVYDTGTTFVINGFNVVPVVINDSFTNQLGKVYTHDQIQKSWGNYNPLSRFFISKQDVLYTCVLFIFLKSQVTLVSTRVSTISAGFELTFHSPVYSPTTLENVLEYRLSGSADNMEITLANVEKIPPVSATSSLTYSDLTTPTLAIARSNSKKLSIEAGKQYFNEMENRVVTNYEGFTSACTTATILSSSPIEFEGDNVLTPSEIPDSEYLLYKIEYVQTSDIKFILVVSVTPMKAPSGGLKGEDVPEVPEISNQDEE